MTRRSIQRATALLLLVVGLRPTLVARAEAPCERIVSLAPSVTESVYELGLGDKLVGRTRFCRFPEAASDIPAVGGFYDASLEAILARRPTHVIALPESFDVAEQASRFGVETIAVDHSSVEGIKQSLRQIAERCGASARAAELLAQYEARERAVAQKVAGQETLRTLVVVGRAQQASEAPSLYVSGNDGFYSEVLSLAGARNVNERRTTAVPILSPEGLLVLKPEAIVEVINADDGISAKDAEQLWQRFDAIPAVKRGKVYILNDDFASIPGPRYIQLVEKLAGLLHPKAGESEEGAAS